MGEREARDLAGRIGGRAHHAGGNIWLVLRDRPDGMLLVIGDEGFSITTRTAFHAGDLDEAGKWTEFGGPVAIDREGTIVRAGGWFDRAYDETGRFLVGPDHWTVLGA
jgi:hypothetical protein